MPPLAWAGCLPTVTSSWVLHSFFLATLLRVASLNSPPINHPVCMCHLFPAETLTDTAGNIFSHSKIRTHGLTSPSASVGGRTQSPSSQHRCSVPHPACQHWWRVRPLRTSAVTVLLPPPLQQPRLLTGYINHFDLPGAPSPHWPPHSPQ